MVEETEYCGECGTELEQDDSIEAESFLEKYGAEPLPLASERGEMISLYASLLGSIPVLGGIMKFFSGISFWCYSVWLKIFTVITMGADVTDRFNADFNYLKDNFYSGYDGSERPPEPPQ
ncbi:hypothetical protein [Haloarcula japonica]|uniref:hypothetical protein n=1 Tax=Haloarcula japonica TaxID=29282 RepID=UPI001268D45E|nr:hypothetical protein [Haloarcula japonica]